MRKKKLERFETKSDNVNQLSSCLQLLHYF